MPLNETIEAFPLFDSRTTTDQPPVSAAIGSRVAVVGSPDALEGAGAITIYFYSPEQNAWGYAGVLTGAQIQGVDQVRALGASCVAFGDTVVVGAPGDDKTPGRVFVLRPPYGRWSYTTIPVITQLSREEPARGDLFGQSVSHCFDGSDHYVAVGAPGAAARPGRSGVGQVAVFRGLDSSDGPWSSPLGNPRVDADDATDRFGASVAISANSDGTLTLAVGAPGADGGQGQVFFGRTAERGTWPSPFSFDAPLVPTFPSADEDFKTSGYGVSVALLDGSTLAVGSPADPNFADQVEEAGAVWLYNYHDGAFVAETPLYGPVQGGRFGASVAFTAWSGLKGTGEATVAATRHLVVGSPGVGAGTARRFAVEAPTGSAGEVKFSPDLEFASLIAKAGDRFGTSVGVSDHDGGTWCIVGAPGNPKAGQDGGGYLFAEGDPAPGWMPMPQLKGLASLRWGGLPPDHWKKYTPQIGDYLR